LCLGIDNRRYWVKTRLSQVISVVGENNGKSIICVFLELTLDIAKTCKPPLLFEQIALLGLVCRLLFALAEFSRKGRRHRLSIELFQHLDGCAHLLRKQEWAGHDCRRTAVTLMQKLGIVQEVRMRVTGHAPPRDGAASYEHHGFEREAYAAVEKLAAELERVRQAVPFSGGG